MISFDTSFDISHASDLFWYLLKTSENLWFSDFFRGFQKRSVAWHGLSFTFQRRNSSESSGIMKWKTIRGLRNKYKFSSCLNGEKTLFILHDIFRSLRKMIIYLVHNPSRLDPERRGKTNLNFYFHFFVVTQKVLWRP